MIGTKPRRRAELLEAAGHWVTAAIWIAGLLFAASALPTQGGP